MTLSEDFVGSLHLIAASAAPLEGQKVAAGQVLERFLRDARVALGGDRLRVRAWVEGLERELMKQAQPTSADLIANLRDHARALVADWLRENPNA